MRRGRASPGAIRAARRRERERRGCAVYAVEVDNRLIELLLDLGWITDAESHDRQIVAARLADALKLWARGLA